MNVQSADTAGASGASGARPPYRVPFMQEIAAIPWNGCTVASTFSGAGGSCLGYRMAGFKVMWANEIVEEARETYRANFPDTLLDGRDIRQVTVTDVLNAIDMLPGELDLFDGSPPCTVFSMAGKREKAWGRVRQDNYAMQRSDDLFFEYARLLRGLQPKTFVAENVKGLVSGKAKGYFLDILAALKECGYQVRAAVVNANKLGVPQHRERLIFVGVREDLCEKYGVAPVLPEPLPYRYTVADVLPHIKRIRLAGERDRWSAATRPAATVVAMDGHRPNDSAYFSAYMVMDATGAVRKYTIPELKAVQSFPQDFTLTGAFGHQWARIGNSVPPLMMMHIARTLFDQVLSRLG